MMYTPSSEGNSVPVVDEGRQFEIKVLKWLFAGWSVPLALPLSKAKKTTGPEPSRYKLYIRLNTRLA